MPFSHAEKELFAARFVLQYSGKVSGQPVQCSECGEITGKYFGAIWDRENSGNCQNTQNARKKGILFTHFPHFSQLFNFFSHFMGQKVDAAKERALWISVWVTEVVWVVACCHVIIIVIEEVAVAGPLSRPKSLLQISHVLGFVLFIHQLPPSIKAFQSSSSCPMMSIKAQCNDSYQPHPSKRLLRPTITDWNWRARVQLLSQGA